MTETKNPAKAQIIAHLAKIAEDTLNDFGIPVDLRDGVIHHNGCEWTAWTVYRIVRRNGAWVEVKKGQYRSSKAVFLLEMSPEACAAGRSAPDAYNRLCIGDEAYARVCNNTFVEAQVARLAA